MAYNQLNKAIRTGRVLPTAKIDCGESVLIDYSTASVVFDPTLRDKVGGQIDYRTWRGKAYANLIQSCVVHEFLLFDSILLDQTHEAMSLLDFESLGLRPVFIDTDLREDVADRIPYLQDEWESAPPDIAELGRLAAGTVDLLEKHAGETSDRLDVSRRHIPEELPCAHMYSDEALDFGVNPWSLPEYAVRSQNTVPRLLFYLLLARSLGIPVRLDPIRSKLLERVNELATIDVPLLGVDEALARMQAARRELTGIATVELPPVVEHVVAISRKEGISLIDSIRKVRASKSAVDFRRLGSHLQQCMHSSKRSNELVSIMSEIQECTKRWIVDIDDGFKFKSRVLKLEELPTIGWLLKVMGFKNPEINDINLTSETFRPGLVFFNDLLRPL